MVQTLVMVALLEHERRLVDAVRLWQSGLEFTSILVPDGVAHFIIDYNIPE